MAVQQTFELVLWRTRCKNDKNWTGIAISVM